jgi:hypothetical protein
MMLRIALLVLGALALPFGLWGALWRLGWTLSFGPGLAALHGPLMISGMFGALIGLERAVALGRDWAYAAPALAGAGTLALVAGAPAEAGAGAYTSAAAVLSGMALLVTVRQPTVAAGTVLLAALAWLAGNVMWMTGESVPDVVGWWLAFLILTVTGERMELSRLVPRGRGSEALFMTAILLFIAGARNGVMTEDGAVLFGLALSAAALWLLRYDIARLNIRQRGQPRFSAACMLAGHGWLAAAGAALLAHPPSGSAFGYDVALHAILIGFALSMVFGHALVILPAVARIRVRYAPILYTPLVLLHASVALRVGAGVAGWDMGRKGSGILTLLSLAFFALGLVLASRLKPGASHRHVDVDVGPECCPRA